MATSRRKPANGGTSKNHQGAPPNAMDILLDMHQRIIRIETRQARQMAAQRMDLEGHPLPPDPAPIKG